MAKARSVFAGFSLSEQTPGAQTPIDQQLFVPTPPPTAKQPMPAPDLVITRPAAATVHPSPPEPDVPQEFDLTQFPYRKDTFLFTSEEFNELDQLKLTLRRVLDKKVTKNDLARCAIHYLVESCRELGAESPVIQPIRKHSGR
jgi:hypothetical protein